MGNEHPSLFKFYKKNETNSVLNVKPKSVLTNLDNILTIHIQPLVKNV